MFETAFAKVKSACKVEKTNFPNFALQVNLIDENASGIMYIAIKDGIVSVEPYDYKDRDAMIEIHSKDLVRILSGRLKVETAVCNGLLRAYGKNEVFAMIEAISTKIVRKK